MRLHELAPRPGAKHRRKRLGCGESSGHGKTSCKGNKGQKARSGSGTRVGFEGGQMPLKIRLPKFGFFSRKSLVSAEVRLNEIAMVEGDVVDLSTLKQAGVVTKNIVFAKVVLSGNIDRAVTVRGVSVTKGARAAIEAAGGKIEE